MSDAGSASRGDGFRFAHPLVPVLVLATLAYGSALRGGFVYDDHRLVEWNPLVRSLAHIPDAFSSDLAGGTEWAIYRPLAAVSFMFDHALFGGSPFGYHVVSLLWHLVTVIGVFLLARGLIGARHGPERGGPGRSATGPSGGRQVWIPTVAAALFAVHPLHSEAVAWISRRSDVMAGAFSLFAVVVARRWLVRGGAASGIGMHGLVVGALLSKEIGVVLPAVLTVAAFASRSPRSAPVEARAGTTASPGAGASTASPGRGGGAALGVRRAVTLLTWVWVPAYAIARERIFGSIAGQPVGPIQNWVAALPGWERWLTIVGLAGRYVELLFVPSRLSADYSYRSLPALTSPLDPHVLLGFVAWGAALAGTISSLRRRSPIAVPLALAVAAYLPVSNAIVPIGTAFAERLFYLPNAGLLIAAGTAAGGLPRSARPAFQRLAVAGLLAIVAAFGVRTYYRGMDWRDDFRLFTRVVATYPENVVAQTYVGIAFRERGDVDGAMDAYRAALAVEPDYHLPRVNLAWLLIERGEFADAVEQARYVVHADPGPGPAHLALGVALAGLGDIEGAERELLLATRDGVTRRDALLALLDVYRRRGDLEHERAVLGALATTPPSPGRPSAGPGDAFGSP
jgi:hypothetical protein